MPVQSKSKATCIQRVDSADTANLKKRRSSKKKTVSEKLDTTTTLKIERDLESNQGLFTFIQNLLESSNNPVDILKELTDTEFKLVANFVHRKVLLISAFDMFNMIYFLQYACRHSHKNFSTVGVSCSTCGYFEIQ